MGQSEKHHPINHQEIHIMKKQNAKKIVIIGAGIGGLGAACYLSKAGFNVTVIEKNSELGGRANIFSAQGFTFDMGPSWYLMPDIFEHFFDVMGEDLPSYLKLSRLSPSYRIFFREETDTSGKPLVIDMHSDLSKDIPTLAPYEEQFAEKIQDYLKQSEAQYTIAKKDFMYRNYNTIFDFFTWDIMKNGLKLNVFSNIDAHISKWFKSDIVKKILEYTMVFLGSSPYETPALYSIMSHIDFNMGVFYPEGGLHSIANALEAIGTKYGVMYLRNTSVTQINVLEGKTTGVTLSDGTVIKADSVVSNADMYFTETKLLVPEYQTYPESYWEKKTLAPSGFILYLGVDKKIPSLTHHNLVFSKDWRKGFGELFTKPVLPTDPSYYVCAPSVTDATVAPAGCENLFVLVPIASGLSYTDTEINAYAKKILDSMEQDLGIPGLKKHITYQRIFSVKDFESMYNAYKGNALSGMAHTLFQTAVFRPDNRSKKVSNLFYVGAGTNPGIGVPICLISAELVYKRIMGVTHAHPITEIITVD
jgi:phytoene desaturase